jgi:uncharacterized protein (TIGR03083 family)
MEHQSFVAAIREQSERFLNVLRGVDADAPVPSCAGWTAADLLWHLGEVQHLWAEVARGAAHDDVVPPDRPDDVASLRKLVATSGTELLGALADREPADECWSWHPDGGSIGWLARRQAHEALIHRVDAELTAGVDVRPPAKKLALDGVDEVLRVFIGGVPDWGEFAPDGQRVLLTSTNLPGRWALELGRFTGTGPESGNAHDLGAALLVDGSADADAEVAGHAWDLVLWLWGRGGTEHLGITGRTDLVDRVRALAAEATQ